MPTLLCLRPCVKRHALAGHVGAGTERRETAQRLASLNPPGTQHAVYHMRLMDATLSYPDGLCEYRVPARDLSVTQFTPGPCASSAEGLHERYAGALRDPSAHTHVPYEYIRDEHIRDPCAA